MKPRLIGGFRGPKRVVLSVGPGPSRDTRLLRLECGHDAIRNVHTRRTWQRVCCQACAPDEMALARKGWGRPMREVREPRRAPRLEARHPVIRPDIRARFLGVLARVDPQAAEQYRKRG